MPEITALIFAKYPIPGMVNTRMVPPLTNEQAAALHEACLRVVWERWGRLGGLRLKLVVTPDERADDLGHVLGAGADDVWVQGRGDLGARMFRAVDQSLTAGASGVILLGADSPTLPQSTIESAVASLANHEGILGPCEDGGYYLMGLRRRCPALFREVLWGQAGVADQTRAQAAAEGLDLFQLPEWYDLDRFEDLERALWDVPLTMDDAEPATKALRLMLEACTEKMSGCDTDG